MISLDRLVTRKVGDSIIFFDGISESKLTYQELHENSDRISQVLEKWIEKMEMPNSTIVVGLYMEMNVMVPGCILGILKSGNCFVYLSPNESVGYLQNLMNRANIEFLITDKTDQELSKTGIVTKEETRILAQPELRIVKLGNNTNGSIVKNGISASEKLAYIMFTSGTTGESKMVGVPHSCIVPNILHLWNEYGVTENDVLFLSSPLTFDPSIVDIFLALSSGATLVMVSDRVKMQPMQLAHTLLDRYRVTILQTTPTLFLRFETTILRRIFLHSPSDPEQSLRVLTLGGEPFPCSVLAPYLMNIHDLPRRRLKIYNIYGTTEVSCWATLHQVTTKDFMRNTVPIGQPMLGTELRLINSTGRIVDEDNAIGELWIGGVWRKCLVDGTVGKINGRHELQSTGDLGIGMTDRNGNRNYYLVGRSDQQVKRMGKRLNLVQISQIIEKNVNVKNCIALLDESNSLRAFIQLYHLASSASVNIGSIENELKQALENCLPCHCRVDTFHFIDSMPVTKHGKIDRRALARMVGILTADLNLPPFSPVSVMDGVMTLLKQVFQSNVDLDLQFDVSFGQLGIDSMRAVSLASKLERWVQRPLPKLVEIILTGTVSVLIQYLIAVSNGKLESSNLTASRKSAALEHALVSRKKLKLDYAPANPLLIFERGGRVRVIGSRLGENWTGDGVSRRIKTKWTWNSGKCIDASPVVIEDLVSAEIRVFIGSHSGKFVCLSCQTGEIVWEQKLADRIEATATVTACGKLLVVGCYDGGVYFLDRLNGDEWWKLPTEDAVKCTACVDSVPFVYVGSHDRHLYKLDYQEKKCIWRINLGSAVLSTPVLNPEFDHVFVATLNGEIHCLTAKTGDTIWRKRLTKPVFSSILLIESCMVIASVDAILHWINIHNGTMVRQFQCGGPIFSTPCVCQKGQSTFLLIGCENGQLYCMDESTARILWIREFGMAISSTPFVFESRISKENMTFCCVAMKTGNIHILKLDDGESVEQWKLDGEVFSSPVLIRDNILIGCRDDSLYCLQFTENDVGRSAAT